MVLMRLRNWSGKTAGNGVLGQISTSKPAEAGPN